MKHPLKPPLGGKAVPVTLGILVALVVLGFYPGYFVRWVVDPPVRAAGAVLTGIGGIFRSSTGLWGRYVALVDAGKENRTLRKQVEDLQRTVDRFQGLKSRNDSLEALLGIRSRLSQNAIACHVIADNPTTGPRTVLLDCGFRAGVRVRDGVIGTRGVVGYVVRVFSGFSQVLWVEDPLFALEGRLSESGQSGLVRGMGSGHSLKLDYVGSLVPAVLGSTIVTTGEDGFFPPDEPIGRIVQSENKQHHIFRTIRLQSQEKLDRLWAVFVLSPPHDWTMKSLMGRKAS